MIIDELPPYLSVLLGRESSFKICVVYSSTQYKQKLIQYWLVNSQGDGIGA